MFSHLPLIDICCNTRVLTAFACFLLCERYRLDYLPIYRVHVYRVNASLLIFLCLNTELT